MKKTLLLLMALFAGLSAWAIEQDSDGNYLIGSVEDWDAFAAIVAETPTANAKMTADVDLGDDQTMIGTAKPYSGTFDGQGHTLNINYTVKEEKCAPFRYISGAIIRRIHVMGNITTDKSYTGGLVGSATGSGGLVEQNWCSVNVTCTGSSRFQSGLVGFVDVSGSNFVVTDNIVDGNQTGKSSGNWGGCIGLRDSGPTTLSNNLITAHFNVGNYSSATQQCWSEYNFTISNNYAIERLYYTEGSDSKTKYITEEQLADGTIATALQAGRDEEIWVQDETTGSPMLKVFLQDDTGDEPKYPITITQHEHGTTTTDTTEAAEGETVKFKIVVDEGYKVSGWDIYWMASASASSSRLKAEGVKTKIQASVIVRDEEARTVEGSFIMPAGEVTVDINFAEKSETEPATGINSVNAEGKAIKAVRVYNVNGAQLREAQSGVNIIVTEYMDGTTSTRKAIK